MFAHCVCLVIRLNKAEENDSITLNVAVNVIIACDIIIGGSLYIRRMGEKVLHWQPQVVCSGFSYLDDSAEWFTQIHTLRSLIEVDMLYSH